jgi:hypothetical protein
MTDGRSTYKKHAKIGPGGMRCHCCGPAPGRDRKRAKRAWKRSERNTVKREIKREIGG